MKLVVGLGNPGREYSQTRHNIGFEAIDQFTGNARFRKKFLNAGICVHGGVVVAKPLTFMNRSGEAVRDLVNFYHLSVSELLVVCDDFSIPLGTIRLKRSGSSGGHNGIKSIIHEMKTEHFSRLRIGVGPVPEWKDPAAFVLEKVFGMDLERIGQMAIKSAECIECVLEHGLEKAMNTYNAA